MKDVLLITFFYPGRQFIKSIVKCLFVSEWDNGCRIESFCHYNPDTGEVVAESSNSDPGSHTSLYREYILINDNALNSKIMGVCMNCHSYVINSSGKCPNKECED
jgi:hypothetical protein